MVQCREGEERVQKVNGLLGLLVFIGLVGLFELIFFLADSIRCFYFLNPTNSSNPSNSTNPSVTKAMLFRIPPDQVRHNAGNLWVLFRLQENFAWVEYSLWVKGLFQSYHEIEGRFRDLHRQVGRLRQPDAMLSG